jgi:virginiamycin A acetyltransferase
MNSDYKKQPTEIGESDMNSSLIYPRKGDEQTVYLKSVISDPSIRIGEYSMYNDFTRDPREFQKNNVLYHYPVNGDRLIMGKYCSVACGA